MKTDKEDFELIYQELVEKNKETLEKAKKERNKNIVIPIIIGILINVVTICLDVTRNLFIVPIMISFVISLIEFAKETSKFRSLFKKLVIEALVSKTKEELVYQADGKISVDEYKESKFDTFFEEWYSEDMIYGYLNKKNVFRMGQITTKKVKHIVDLNGNSRKEKITTFRGIYGIVKLKKSINADIHLLNNSFTKKYSSQRIEMDSAEFEQEFDCLTKDKLVAMKIFRADLLEKFVNLKKANLSNFELKIIDDNIYFRCACGDIFEPPKIKNILDKEVIRKYYNIIVLPIDIMEKIIENIEML